MYEFNLLHHVGVVAKGLRAAAAETAAQEGDDNTPSGPGVKYTLVHPPLYLSNQQITRWSV